MSRPLRVAVRLLHESFAREVRGKGLELGHRSVLVFDRRERFVA